MGAAKCFVNDSFSVDDESCSDSFCLFLPPIDDVFSVSVGNGVVKNDLTFGVFFFELLVDG
jgi:hypothetical protein